MSDARDKIRAFLGQPTQQDLLKKVDDRAVELIAQFREHCNECKATVPDERVVYESWVIQKIAGIHVMMEEMQKTLDALANKSLR
jgi:hypothetical protein